MFVAKVKMFNSKGNNISFLNKIFSINTITSASFFINRNNISLLNYIVGISGLNTLGTGVANDSKRLNELVSHFLLNKYILSRYVHFKSRKKRIRAQKINQYMGKEFKIRLPKKKKHNRYKKKTHYAGTDKNKQQIKQLNVYLKLRLKRQRLFKKISAYRFSKINKFIRYYKKYYRIKKMILRGMFVAYPHSNYAYIIRAASISPATFSKKNVARRRPMNLIASNDPRIVITPTTTLTLSRNKKYMTLKGQNSFIRRIPVSSVYVLHPDSKTIVSFQKTILNGISRITFPYAFNKNLLNKFLSNFTYGNKKLKIVKKNKFKSNNLYKFQSSFKYKKHSRVTPRKFNFKLKLKLKLKRKNNSNILERYRIKFQNNNLNYYMTLGNLLTGICLFNKMYIRRNINYFFSSLYNFNTNQVRSRSRQFNGDFHLNMRPILLRKATKLILRVRKTLNMRLVKRNSSLSATVFKRLKYYAPLYGNNLYKRLKHKQNRFQANLYNYKNKKNLLPVTNSRRDLNRLRFSNKFSHVFYPFSLLTPSESQFKTSFFYWYSRMNPSMVSYSGVKLYQSSDVQLFNLNSKVDRTTRRSSISFRQLNILLHWFIKQYKNRSYKLLRHHYKQLTSFVLIVSKRTNHYLIWSHNDLLLFSKSVGQIPVDKKQKKVKHFNYILGTKLIPLFHAYMRSLLLRRKVKLKIKHKLRHSLMRKLIKRQVAISFMELRLKGSFKYAKALWSNLKKFYKWTSKFSRNQRRRIKQLKYKLHYLPHYHSLRMKSKKALDAQKAYIKRGKKPFKLNLYQKKTMRELSLYGRQYLRFFKIKYKFRKIRHLLPKVTSVRDYTSTPHGGCRRPVRKIIY